MWIKQKNDKLQYDRNFFLLFLIIQQSTFMVSHVFFFPKHVRNNQITNRRWGLQKAVASIMSCTHCWDYLMKQQWFSSFCNTSYYSVIEKNDMIISSDVVFQRRQWKGKLSFWVTIWRLGIFKFIEHKISKVILKYNHKLLQSTAK